VNNLLASLKQIVDKVKLIHKGNSGVGISLPFSPGFHNLKTEIVHSCLHDNKGFQTAK